MDDLLHRANERCHTYDDEHGEEGSYDEPPGREGVLSDKLLRNLFVAAAEPTGHRWGATDEQTSNDSGQRRRGRQRTFQPTHIVSFGHEAMQVLRVTDEALKVTPVSALLRLLVAPGKIRGQMSILPYLLNFTSAAVVVTYSVECNCISSIAAISRSCER